MVKDRLCPRHPSTIFFSVPQTLQREMEGHQPRVDEVLERGRRMAAAAEAGGRPEAGRIGEQLEELEKAWERLQDQMSKRRDRLNGSNLAQQYYNDADEAEAWIGEQELYMIADEKAKVGGGGSSRTAGGGALAPHPSLLPSLQDEQSAMLMLKRHTILKQAVDDYADSIRKLSDRAQRMFTEEHPQGFVFTARPRSG